MPSFTTFEKTKRKGKKGKGNLTLVLRAVVKSNELQKLCNRLKNVITPTNCIPK